MKVIQRWRVFKWHGTHESKATPPDPFKMIPTNRYASLVCNIVAGGIPTEYHRLYHHTPYAEVWEMYALLRAQNLPP